MVRRHHDTGFNRAGVLELVTDMGIQRIVRFACREYDNIAEERGLNHIVNSKPVPDVLLDALALNGS